MDPTIESALNRTERRLDIAIKQRVKREGDIWIFNDPGIPLLMMKELLRSGPLIHPSSLVTKEGDTPQERRVLLPKRLPSSTRTVMSHRCAVTLLILCRIQGVDEPKIPVECTDYQQSDSHLLIDPNYEGKILLWKQYDDGD